MNVIVRLLINACALHQQVPAAGNWNATECGYDDADNAIGDVKSHDAVGGGAESLVGVEAKVEEQDRGFDEASADEVGVLA